MKTMTPLLSMQAFINVLVFLGICRIKDSDTQTIMTIVMLLTTMISTVLIVIKETLFQLVLTRR